MTTLRVKKTIFFAAILVALSTYFLTDSYVKKLRKEVGEIVDVNLSAYRIIENFNVSFLRARRSEKNLIIFKDNTKDLERYRNDLDRYLKDVNRYYTELEHMLHKPEDRELLYPLKKNIEDYKVLVDKLFSSLFGGNSSSEEIQTLSLNIRDLNDALSDNVMYLLNKNNSDKQILLSKIDTNFSYLKYLPALILIISTAVMLMVAIYGVREKKRTLL
ncbi:MAG TPA: hypothetical protein VMD04_00185 [Candidatus Margulisiibacteriota bacterium]|nr:hypothetical protein [Candidatus Margulisiibacteriota bacterium]